MLRSHFTPKLTIGNNRRQLYFAINQHNIKAIYKYSHHNYVYLLFCYYIVAMTNDREGSS